MVRRGLLPLHVCTCLSLSVCVCVRVCRYKRQARTNKRFLHSVVASTVASNKRQHNSSSGSGSGSQLRERGKK